MTAAMARRNAVEIDGTERRVEPQEARYLELLVMRRGRVPHNDAIEEGKPVRAKLPPATGERSNRKFVRTP